MIINRATPAIRELQKNYKREVYVSFTDGERFYFTGAACDLCELTPGKYMHFINEGKDFSFYTNNDKDGFPLIADGKKRGCLISNSALGKYFTKAIQKYERLMKFYINKTSQEKNGCMVFEIFTEKPMAQKRKNLL